MDIFELEKVPYRAPATLLQKIRAKAIQNSATLDDLDFIWLEVIKAHYYRYFTQVKVLPDAILAKELGFDYDQFNVFCATFRAFADFFILLGTSSESFAKQEPNSPKSFQYMNDWVNWIVFSGSNRVFEPMRAISKLPNIVFDALLSYYLENFRVPGTLPSEAVSGDGYMAPVFQHNNHVIFGAYAIKYLLTFNNVIYSVNKGRQKLFDESVSAHLEPTLIGQLKYLFSSFTKVETRENVVYEGGELDLIAFDTLSSTALCFQVKATIAPDSVRTVNRVEDRALEGIKQIRHFQSKSGEERHSILESAFNCKVQGVTFINCLCVRSAVGSAKIWAHRKEVAIVNYMVVCTILARMAAKGEQTFQGFAAAVSAFQEELMHTSNCREVEETLEVAGHTISFPNIHSTTRFIVSSHVEIMRIFPAYEDVHGL